MVYKTLCRRDRAPIEGGDPSCKCVDKAVQLFIWKRAVDVPVLRRGIAVEVVGAKNDFERAAAADQWREGRRGAAARGQPHFRLPLSQPPVLPRRPKHIPSARAVS